jgi:hypothetical protein
LRTGRCAFSKPRNALSSASLLTQALRRALGFGFHCGARFNRDEFDLVGVGRSLLHDPQWTHKLRTGADFSEFSSESLKVLT